jgi:hypothetical protein
VEATPHNGTHSEISIVAVTIHQKSRLVEDGEVFKCLDAFPPGRAGDQFTIQHGCQAVLSAMFAANDIWAAGEAERLTRLGDEYSSLAGLDIPLEAA